MRIIHVIILIGVLLLQVVGVAYAQIPPYIVPNYFTKTGQVKLIETVVDKEVTSPDGTSNTNWLKYFTQGSEPAVDIGAWWFKQQLGNATWYCQSVLGLRGYATDFPRVVLKINKLYTAWWHISTGGYHYSDLPILVLGHVDNSKVLVARVRAELNPTDNTWQFGILIGIYNLETQTWEQYVEIFPYGNSTSLPVYLDLIPEFYSYTNTTSNITTIIYGWRMRVWSSGTGLLTYEYKQNTEYKIAYENITVPTPVTLDEVSEFVRRMRGWYVWIGSGLSVYVNDKSVRYCEQVALADNVNDASYLSEYVIGYPLVENWKVNIKQLYESFTSGKLEVYKGPEVAVQNIVAEQDWSALYSAIIPWAFGLAVGYVIMQASRSRATGTAGAIGTTIAAGYLMGWGTTTILVTLVGAGIALYLLLGHGEE